LVSLKKRAGQGTVLELAARLLQLSSPHDWQ
jgi:hypothetical protein